jgi:hypothetical protein
MIRLRKEPQQENNDNREPERQINAQQAFAEEALPGIPSPQAVPRHGQHAVTGNHKEDLTAEASKPEKLTQEGMTVFEMVPIGIHVEPDEPEGREASQLVQELIPRAGFFFATHQFSLHLSE